MSAVATEPLRRPTVTVVIPCYNYGHYLPTAVQSVLTQEGVETDAIVIDDASPDGSAAVVRALAKDDRVQPILHSANRGHVATYNEGLALAAGEYVVLLSADDALAPGALARAAALMEAHPSVGFVYGHPVVFADEPPSVSVRIRGWTVWPGEEWIARRCRTGRNCIHSPEVVMRTSVQNAIGGYDAQLPHSGDFEMWLRAAAISDVGRVNGPPQAFYRLHGESMQRTTYAGHVNDLEGRLGAIEKVLGDRSSALRDRDSLRSMARESLAASALEYARSAYDHGHGQAEPVRDYLSFAERVWPAVRETRKWRVLEKVADADPAGSERGLGPLARRTVEDLRWRVRWRRWRWSGL